MKQLFLQTVANENQEHVLEMMRHPRSVVTFSDSGAHVSQLMDSSLQSHVLSYWVRERQALTLEEAIRMLTFVPASHWGLAGRGMLRTGWAADLMIFNPDAITPEVPELAHDLPAGARRLKQKASGILATIVNGEVLLRNNEHTGALPGKLLRGPLAATALSREHLRARHGPLGSLLRRRGLYQGQRLHPRRSEPGSRLGR
jgi:N-acyl-D-amino-acid deacylase